MPQTGTVKFFDAKKGFGFFVPDHRGPDIFVHITQVEKSGRREIYEGERVSFDIEEKPDGRLQAINIVITG